MKILKSVVNLISKAASQQSFEIGGIIGSHSNDTIDEVVIDLLKTNNINCCSYSPNVIFLNQNIDSWQNNNIEFKGVFHTHFFGIKTLSCGDKKYINEIMRVMPENIKFLYFPVFVLPDMELVCYKAIKKNQSIFIKEEPIVMV